MIWLIILSVWLVCSASAFALLVDDWRRRWDVTRADVVLFAVLSAGGPPSLILAAIIWATGLGHYGESPVIWEAKK